MTLCCVGSSSSSSAGLNTWHLHNIYIHIRKYVLIGITIRLVCSNECWTLKCYGKDETEWYEARWRGDEGKMRSASRMALSPPIHMQWIFICSCRLLYFQCNYIATSIHTHGQTHIETASSASTAITPAQLTPTTVSITALSGRFSSRVCQPKEQHS